MATIRRTLDGYGGRRGGFVRARGAGESAGSVRKSAVRSASTAGPPVRGGGWERHRGTKYAARTTRDTRGGLGIAEVAGRPADRSHAWRSTREGEGCAAAGRSVARGLGIGRRAWSPEVRRCAGRTATADAIGDVRWPPRGGIYQRAGLRDRRGIADPTVSQGVIGQTGPAPYDPSHRPFPKHRTEHRSVLWVLGLCGETGGTIRQARAPTGSGGQGRAAPWTERRRAGERAAEGTRRRRSCEVDAAGRRRKA